MSVGGARIGAGRPRVDRAIESLICELLLSGKIVSQVAEVVPDLDISTVRKIAKRNGIRPVRAKPGRHRDD